MATTGDVAGAGTFGALAAIRRQFPGWRPWRSDAGRFWATRIGVRLPDHPPDWWAMTVDADTAGKLHEALSDQEARAG